MSQQRDSQGESSRCVCSHFTSVHVGEYKGQAAQSNVLHSAVCENQAGLWEAALFQPPAVRKIMTQCLKCTGPNSSLG